MAQSVIGNHMQDRFAKIIEIVHRHMETPSTSWNIGSFGAIAEFHKDPEETVKRSMSPSGGTILRIARRLNALG